MKFPRLIPVLLIAVVLTACTGFLKKKTERPLARVGSAYLYESDLAGVVPRGTPANDSLELTRSYIDSWVRKQLLLGQAMNNLPKEEMDFSAELEEYKNSLVIYAYENALVRQKLDTVVSDEDIENYYNANQNNFQLKDNIVQVQYVKLPANSQYIRQIKKLLNEDNPVSRNRLAELCTKNAGDYFLDDQNWISFSDVLKQVPIKTYNQEDFLNNNREIEYRDSAFVYLVKIRDFKIKESISPLGFEKDRIRNILLNKRKLELIGRMQQDVYDKAQKRNDFEIY
jgi:hypothetical protein